MIFLLFLAKLQILKQQHCGKWTLRHLFAKINWNIVFFSESDKNKQRIRLFEYWSGTCCSFDLQHCRVFDELLECMKSHSNATTAISSSKTLSTLLVKDYFKINIYPRQLWIATLWVYLLLAPGIYIWSLKTRPPVVCGARIQSFFKTTPQISLQDTALKKDDK